MKQQDPRVKDKHKALKIAELWDKKKTPERLLIFDR